MLKRLRFARKQLLGGWIGLVILKSLLANAVEFRAARSVHLGYPAPACDVFHNAMVIEKSVNGSYFMAAGWDTGYFGLQQLDSPTNKVVIFSVWDPTAGDDPNAVKTEDRVEVLYSDPGVRIRRFGGEGTGGQAMAPFPWTLGTTNRFLMRSEVQGKKTAYTAYLYQPTSASWRRLATFRTMTGGRPIKGTYSFVEDFRRDVQSVNETRRARFLHGWVHALQEGWLPLTRARFTGSGADWESKDNIDAGLVGDGFFLATGGTIKMSHPLQTMLELNFPPGLSDLPSAPSLIPE